MKKNINKFVEIVIHWSILIVGLLTDIKIMHNRVKLREEDWCLQQRRSGKRLAERALSETGRISAEEYSQVNQTVQNDIYADDCLLGEEENVEKALQRTDEPKVVNR